VKTVTSELAKYKLDILEIWRDRRVEGGS